MQKKKNWRPFAEARSFARTLGLKKHKEWQAYCKSGQKPDDIPSAPDQVYKPVFQSWGNWLGTDFIATYHRTYRPFAEARSFARTLGLKTYKEWRVYGKSGQKPDDIPYAPPQVYKKEFKTWGDWLGTDFIATHQRVYRSFAEARSFARTLGLKNYKEWQAYCKSGRKPDDIPSVPHRTYKKEFKTWGDWFGTDFIATYKRAYRSFAEARSFVHTLGLKNGAEWLAYCASGQKPDDIPMDPNGVYGPLFINIGDWLGTDFIAPQHRVYRLFTEARSFVHTLGLKSQVEWHTYCKSGEKPDDIPSVPNHVYKEEFKTWGDWLGTGFIATQRRIYRSFAEARSFVHTLGLKNYKEWLAYCASGQKPDDIPNNPQKTYGLLYCGLEDWLGIEIRWHKRALRNMLEDLRPHLDDLKEHELYTILQQMGALPALRWRLKMSPLQVLQTLGKNYPRIAECLAQEEVEIVPPMQKHEALLQPEDLQDLSAFLMKQEKEVPESENTMLPGDDLATSLHTLDYLALHFEKMWGEETLHALIDNRVADLWQQYMHEGEKVISTLLDTKGGRFFTEIKERFLRESEAVARLEIPPGWSFTDAEGYPASPNTMQRYIAWAMREKRRQGNWSGTGAGKSLAAILSSRVCQAHLTIIVTNLATIDHWRRQILQAYPESKVFLGFHPDISRDKAQSIYLLAHYEQFQLADRLLLIEQLLSLKIDFVVLDEIQYVKRRNKKASLRRQSLEMLLTRATKQNPDLSVLAMSATPVLNELSEGKTILELLLGQTLPDLGCAPTIDNALALYRAFLRYGFRYRPRYEQELHLRLLPTRRNDLLPILQEIEWSLVSVESALLLAKLEAVQPFIQPGVVLYSYYIDQGAMIETIRTFIEKLGFSVGCYTGPDKTGLDLFLRGKIDVLLGSRPLGIGLDGLQMRAHRLIIFSLPWTGAEYDQLLGRIRRQGSHFGTCEVFLPQVVLDDGQDRTWSYDRARSSVLHEKRTLSDCALDGRIPRSISMSEQTLLRQCREALDSWIARTGSLAAETE